MAVIQLNQRYLALALLTILGCLALLQLILPGTPTRTSGAFKRDTETSRHSHFNFEDYDFFYSGLFSRRSTEVPRNILGEEIRYLINNPVCDPSHPQPSGGAKPPEVFMVILITSYVGDVKLRRRLREAVPQSELDKVSIKRLFLLAKPPPKYQAKDDKYVDVPIKEIFEENGRHRDILMGDFTESYKSLTYKHLMGLEWAATFCQNAKFVLKQDDDIAVDYFQIYQLLRDGKVGEGSGGHWIFGKILDSQPVDRDPTSKWYVSKAEFPEETYPPYVSGWAYVTTLPAIQEILRVTQEEKPKYFFIDDAFVTGILRDKAKVPVELKDMENYFTQYKGQLLCCVSVPMFAMSKNKEPFWCDYLVGPSNGDLDLIDIYQRHSQYCWVSKQCRRREENEVLRRKCVITGNMKVQDFSQWQGKGAAKPLAVIRKQ